MRNPVIGNLTGLEVGGEVLSEGAKGEDIGCSRDEWPASVSQVRL